MSRLLRGLRLLHPRFLSALVHSVLLKLRYGSALDIDLLRVFIHPSVELTISGGGSVRARVGKRVFISRGSVIRASGGRIEFGDGVFLNQNCMIVSHEAISLGPDCMLGPNVSVFDSDHRFDRTDVPFSSLGYRVSATLIDRNVWLGANTVVTRGSHIGASVVVGANSVVKGTLSSGTVYAGNPLRKVREIGAPWDGAESGAVGTGMQS